MKQNTLTQKNSKSYGGRLFTTRDGRSGPRPLETKRTMHLVLRSSKARGEWAFSKHKERIKEITDRFAAKNGIKVLRVEAFGEHLHFHIQLNSRSSYAPFIRAITAAISMAVTGVSRWRPSKRDKSSDRFWDQRPFTRVVTDGKSSLTTKDYLAVNKFDGVRRSPNKALLILKNPRN